MTTTQTPSRSNGTHWVNGVCSYGHDITDPRNLRTRRDRTRSRECRQCHNDRRRERAAKAPGTKPCLYCGHRYDAGRPGTRGYEIGVDTTSDLTVLPRNVTTTSEAAG